MFTSEIGLGGFLTIVPLAHHPDAVIREYQPVTHPDGKTEINFGVGVIRITVFGEVVERIRMEKPQNETTLNEILALYSSLCDWMDVRDPHHLYGRPVPLSRRKHVVSTFC